MSHYNLRAQFVLCVCTNNGSHHDRMFLYYHECGQGKCSVSQIPTSVSVMISWKNGVLVISYYYLYKHVWLYLTQYMVFFQTTEQTEQQNRTTGLTHASHFLLHLCNKQHSKILSCFALPMFFFCRLLLWAAVDWPTASTRVQEQSSCDYEHWLPWTVCTHP